METLQSIENTDEEILKRLSDVQEYAFHRKEVIGYRKEYYKRHIKDIKRKLKEVVERCETLFSAEGSFNNKKVGQNRKDGVY